MWRCRLDAELNSVGAGQRRLRQLVGREHAKLKRREKLQAAHAAIWGKLKDDRHIDATWHDRRKLALEWYFFSLAEQSDSVEDALTLAARVTDVCKDSVRRWRDGFLDRGDDFWSDSYQEWGKHPKVRCLLHET
jgi:hypothetical protein